MDLPPFRALAQTGYISLVFRLQQLVILSRLAVHLTTESYTSTLGCCSVRNRSKLVEKLEDTKNEKKQSPTETSRASFADSYDNSSSQATTAREIEARSLWDM